MIMSAKSTTEGPNPERSTRDLNAPTQDSVLVYATPWKKGLFKDKKLSIYRDENNVIYAEIITKHLFTRREGEVVTKRIFAPINEEALQREIKTLEAIVKAKGSINGMLVHLENDFTPLKPSSPKSGAPEVPSPSSNQHPELPSGASKIGELQNEIDLLKAQVEKLVPSPETATPTPSEASARTPTPPPSSPDSPFAAPTLPSPTPEQEPPPVIPVLSDEEIAERLAEVEKLRSTLKALLEEIQQEENAPNRKFLRRLKDIESAALQAIEQLKQLDSEALKIDVPFKEHLSASSDKINRSKGVWAREVAEIRATREAEQRQAALEEANLEKQAAAIAPQLETFAEEIESEWAELLAAWTTDKKSPAVTLEQVRERSESLNAKIEQITSKCKEYTALAVPEGERALNAIEEAMVPKVTRYTPSREIGIINSRKEMIDCRKVAWQALTERQAALKDNLDEIVRFNQEVEKAKEFDASMQEILNHLKPVSNTLLSCYEKAAALSKSLLNKFTGGTTTAAVLAHMPLIDEAIAEQLDYLLAEIGTTGQALLHSGLIASNSAYATQFNLLINKQAFTKEALDRLINNITTDNPPGDHPIADYTKLLHLHQLVGLLLKSQFASRSLLQEKLDDYLQKVETGHDSIKEYTQALFASTCDLMCIKPEANLQEFRKISAQNLMATNELLSKFEITVNALEPIQKAYAARVATFAESLKPGSGHALTGAELEHAQVTLRELQDELDFRPLIKSDALTLPIIKQYEQNLQAKVLIFENYVGEEKRKNDLRAEIAKDVANFVSKMNLYNSQVAELELRFEIDLADIHEKFNQAKAKAESWKTNGELPQPLPGLGYTNPASLYLKSNVPFTSIELPWAPDHVEVANLSSKELVRYQTHLKSLLETEKSALLKTIKITEAHDASIKFDVRKGFITKRITDLQDKKYQQLQRSAVLQKQLDKLLLDQKNAIQNSPSIPKILQRLKNDAVKIDRLLTDFPLLRKIDLLTQMKKCQPDEVKLKEDLRTAFLEEHAENVAAKKSELKILRNKLQAPYLDMQAEADKILKDLDEELAQYKYTFPAYVEGWVSIQPWRTENLILEQLNADQLYSYALTLDKIVAKHSNRLNLIMQQHAKTEKAQELLLRKVNEVENKIKELENADLLLSAAELKAQLKNYEDAAAGKITPEWYRSTGSYNPFRRTYFHKHHAVMGVWISLFEGELQHIKKNPASLPKQLELVLKQTNPSFLRGIWNSIPIGKPDPQLITYPNTRIVLDQAALLELAGKIRERFEEKVLTVITTNEIKLKQIKHKLAHSLSLYVPPDSSLYANILSTIDEKLEILKKQKKEFETHKGIFGILGSVTNIVFHPLATTRAIFRDPSILIPRLSDLNPFYPSSETKSLKEFNSAEMERYAQAIESESAGILTDLEDTYHIQKIIENESQFNTALKTAHEKADRLIASGQRFNGYMLKRKAKEIEAKFNNWKLSVTSVRDLKTLSEMFKTGYREIIEATKKSSFEQTNAQQIRSFLAQSKATGENVKDEIELLRLAVIQSIKSKIDQSNRDVDKEAKKLKDINDTFNLNISFDDQIAACHNNINKFKDSCPLYSNWRHLGLTNKNYDELTAEESILAEEYVQTESLKSLNELSSNLGSLTTNYSSYSSALHAAEKTRETLELKKQFAAAQRLKTEVEQLKKAHLATWLKDESAPGILRRIGNGVINLLPGDGTTTAIIAGIPSAIRNFRRDDTAAIETFSTHLKRASDTILAKIDEINSDPEEDLIDQLEDVPPEEINKVRNALASSLTDAITDGKAKLNKFETIVTSLAQLDFPQAWRQAISDDLKQCRQGIEEQEKGLSVVTQGIFSRSTTVKPLDNLSNNEYTRYKNDLDDRVEKIEDLDKKYSLTTLKTQLQEYLQLKKQALETAKHYQNAKQIKHASDLSDKVAEVDSSLKTQYDTALSNARQGTTDLSAALSTAITQINQQMSIVGKRLKLPSGDLYKVIFDKGVRALGGATPPNNFDELFKMLSDSGNIEKQKIGRDLVKECESLKRHLLKELTVKANAHFTKFTELQNQLKAIETTLNEMWLNAELPTIDFVPVSVEWKSATAAAIDSLKKDIHNDLDLLAKKNNFEEFAKLEMHARQYLNDQLPTLIKGPTDALEKITGLRELIKGLETFQETNNRVTESCKSSFLVIDDRDKAVRDQLKLLQKTQIALVVKAFNNLSGPTDSKECLSIIERASTKLALGVNALKAHPAIADLEAPMGFLDPWTKIALYETSRTFIPFKMHLDRIPEERGLITAALHTTVDSAIALLQAQQIDLTRMPAGLRTEAQYTDLIEEIKIRITNYTRDLAVSNKTLATRTQELQNIRNRGHVSATVHRWMGQIPADRIAELEAEIIELNADIANLKALKTIAEESLPRAENEKIGIAKLRQFMQNNDYTQQILTRMAHQLRWLKYDVKPTNFGSAVDPTVNDSLYVAQALVRNAFYDEAHRSIKQAQLDAEEACADYDRLQGIIHGAGAAAGGLAPLEPAAAAAQQEAERRAREREYNRIFENHAAAVVDKPTTIDGFKKLATYHSTGQLAWNLFKSEFEKYLLLSMKDDEHKDIIQAVIRQYFNKFDTVLSW